LAREGQVKDVGAGAVAHVKQVHGPTPVGEKILKLRVELPKSRVSEGFDVDEVRIKIEESVEQVIKAAIGLDDSDRCESASNQIYRTMTAAAYRIDFCLGLCGHTHVHAIEEYGWDTVGYWHNIDVYFEEVKE
jgi:hypothetical protein